MTLITRIIGKERIIIASDSQINSIEGLPYFDKGKIVQKQKLLPFPRHNLVLGFSGALNLKDNEKGIFYDIIDICHDYFENADISNYQSSFDIVTHLDSLDIHKLIGGAHSLIMTAERRDEILNTDTILIDRNGIILKSKPTHTDILHTSTIWYYCNGDKTKYDEFIAYFDVDKIRAFVDINFDYGLNDEADLNNHPCLMYTILCITAFELNFRLNQEFFDKLSYEQIELFLSNYYKNIQKLRNDRNIVRKEIGILNTIGDLAHYAILNENELKFEIFKRSS